MIVLFQAKRGEKMKAKNMKAEIVKVIRTDTAEGKGTEESPVRSVRRYWTLPEHLHWNISGYGNGSTGKGK